MSEGDEIPINAFTTEKPLAHALKWVEWTEALQKRFGLTNNQVGAAIKSGLIAWKAGELRRVDEFTRKGTTMLNLEDLKKNIDRIREFPA